MKNEVRPIDANAAIEALRANFQQGSWYGCEEPGYQIAEETIEEMPTLKPVLAGGTLTLEQLRKMDGQPVWVERNENPHDGKWFIVDRADVENPDKTLYTKEGVTYSDYGAYFTAYVSEAFFMGKCNECAFLNQCKNDRDFKFPDSAYCQKRKREILKGWG